MTYMNKFYIYFQTLLLLLFLDDFYGLYGCAICNNAVVFIIEVQRIIAVK